MISRILISILLLVSACSPEPTAVSTTLATTTTRVPGEAWRALPDAPGGPREIHEAVWTGTEMIIFGGRQLAGDFQEALDTVVAYDPATDSWSELPASPHAFLGMTAVWTGTEIIVWGGEPIFGSGELVASGAAFNPTTRTWRMIPDAPIAGRRWHVAVWTGRVMIVWGGEAQSGGDTEGVALDGAAYNPGTDEWWRIADAPVAVPPSETIAIWDGLQMLVWTGASADGSGSLTTQGLIYDVVTDTWELIPAAPLEGGHYRGVWTGDEFVVVGGGQVGEQGFWAAAFATLRREWRTLGNPRMGTSEIRWNMTASWTGTHVAVVGGNRNAAFGPIGPPLLLSPEDGTWSSADAPIGQLAGHSAVWTGEELLIWGGTTSLPSSTIPEAGPGYSWRPAPVPAE